jgi:WD40 repeat protein
MRFLLSCLLLVGVLLPARAQDDELSAERPDEGDPSARAILGFNTGHHVGPINALLFTPDGGRVISAGADRTIQVWDVHSGERVRVYRPPVGRNGGGTIMAAALAPDGKTLACGGAGVVFDGARQPTNALYLLNLEDGRILPLPMKGEDARAVAVTFSPDGNRLAAASPTGRGRIIHLYQGLKGIWDRASSPPKPWREFKAGGTVPHLAFSPDGSHLAETTIVPPGVHIWDLDAPDKPPVTPGDGKFLAPISLAWTPDGRLLTGHRIEHPRGLALFVWSADGKQLKSFSGAALGRSWPPGEWFNIHRLFPIRDNQVLLMEQAGSEGLSPLLLDLESGKCQLVASLPADVYRYSGAGALSPDGRRAALATAPEGRRIALVDVQENAKPRYLAGEGRTSAAIGWRNDGYAIAWNGPAGAASSALDLRRLERTALPPGERLRQDVLQRDGWTLDRARPAGEGHLVLSHGGQAPVKLAFIGDPVLSFTLPAAGEVSWVAWTSRDGLHVSDPITGKNGLHFLPRGRAMRSVASSPDGKYLLAYSARGLYYVYRPDQAEPLLTAFVAGPDWVVWTQDAYYAATPGGERLIGWTVNNGPTKLAAFYPAERFRKVLYRPDVIRLVLDKGNVKDALAAADAARDKEGEKVAKGKADLEQLLPPRAALEVVDKTALPKVKVKATAEAAAKGQPVTSLRLLVDGRRLPEGGVLDLKAGQEKAEATWEVELPPGPHDLKVLASGPDTSAASAAVPLDVPVPSTAGRPTLHLIAIGIDTYPKKDLQLTCAARDARELARAFAEHCAGPGNLFGAATVTPLLDGDAKRAAVLAALREARQAVKPGDLLVFSFAGHGARQGKAFYLLTADADPDRLAGTALSGEDLRAALADMPCQVLLLLDACHAAAGVRAFIDEAARGLTDDETGVAVLCAAMGSEEAQEKDGHGLFTRAVLGALGGADGVPFNRHDRRQYVHHLGAFVQDEVRELSHDEQHPFLTMPYVTESFPVRLLPPK